MFSDSPLLGEMLIVAAIVAGSLIAAWVAMHVLRRVESAFAARSSTAVDERVVHAISGPVVLLVLLQGVFLAAFLFAPLTPYRVEVQSLWKAAVIGVLAIAVANVANVLLGWYGQGTNAYRLERQLMGPLRRIVIVAIYSLASMVILDQLGISVSPLLAGLGIGGLAVALALQPTLSNFFAGTYLVSDRVTNPGDFIELENGLQGYVVDVGWRSTRIRTPYNNLVVIPNARLADSVVTNYDNPTTAIGVLVSGGVSYSSDLAHVRRVAIEAAQEAINGLKEADPAFEPWFGYEEFGESNITFWVWAQARDRLGSFAVKTSLIEHLHRRFREEDITINYPVRQIISAWDPKVPMLRRSADAGVSDG